MTAKTPLHITRSPVELLEVDLEVLDEVEGDHVPKSQEQQLREKGVSQSVQVRKVFPITSAGGS